jgi:hypothetical protein
MSAAPRPVAASQAAPSGESVAASVGAGVGEPGRVASDVGACWLAVGAGAGAMQEATNTANRGARIAAWPNKSARDLSISQAASVNVT